MSEDFSAEQARAALDRASQSADRVNQAGVRWVRVSKWVLAGIFALATLVWGFVEPHVLRAVLTLCAAALAFVWVAVWSRFDRAVERRDVKRRRLWELDLTSVFFFLVIVGGHFLTGQAWYWIPGALVVAAPIAVSAIRTRRP